MTTKQERLHKVYEHIRWKYNIHTQQEFAETIDVTRSALSKAMNGNDSYLTKNLFKKICVAFPGEFNLSYLISGNGELLYQGEPDTGTQVSEDIPLPHMPIWADTLITILSKQITENEALHAELKQSIEQINELKKELQSLINNKL